MFARPSFQEPDVIHAFHTYISWDHAEKVLLVKENAAHKKQAAQFGKIYIPRASMHIFILSDLRPENSSKIESQHFAVAASAGNGQNFNPGLYP